MTVKRWQTMAARSAATSAVAVRVGVLCMVEVVLQWLAGIHVAWVPLGMGRGMCTVAMGGPSRRGRRGRRGRPRRGRGRGRRRRASRRPRSRLVRDRRRTANSAGLVVRSRRGGWLAPGDEVVAVDAARRTGPQVALRAGERRPVAVREGQRGVVDDLVLDGRRSPVQGPALERRAGGVDDDATPHRRGRRRGGGRRRRWRIHATGGLMDGQVAA